MYEKKIDFKRSIMVAFLISVFLTFAYFVVTFVSLILFPCDPIYDQLYPIAAQKNNEKFEAYFGFNKSQLDVKQLCDLVHANNELVINSEANQENKKIGLLFKDSTGVSQKQPTEISALVKKDYRYIVELQNDRVSDEDLTNISDGDASYYKNSFIRVIIIEECEPRNKNKEASNTVS